MNPLCSQVKFIITDDDINRNEKCLTFVRPRLVDYLDDGHGDISPLVLIGLRGLQPVYRVTHTCALDREGDNIGDFEVHWPPLFPNVRVSICEVLQLDVTIRIKPSDKPTPRLEGADDDNNNSIATDDNDDYANQAGDDDYHSDEYTDYDHVDDFNNGSDYNEYDFIDDDDVDDDKDGLGDASRN
ncbi:unnamed protein product [Rotaria sp. Silwood1]|nr:unnamed protein product [Rotaria sp. Silwood1]CAF1613873.1 unnamed protein product [Rotaria sp. Silwood1]CAF3691491.1 unnamed protein product [Rotaria sp. Silwood1]CAF3740466.1 unnamed protein product [Rotaria sp. Silwood1]CAF3808862.1 unnamed protein product [Rotaria sp. Silwood1]